MSNTEEQIIAQGEVVESTELIRVTQLPIIEQKLQEKNAEIMALVRDARNMPCNTATVTACKQLRADIRKQFDVIEENRKAVKAAIMAPYTDFDAMYKHYISGPFGEADDILKAKINEVDGSIKCEKEAALARWAVEYRLSLGLPDYTARFDTGVKVNLSTSDKKLREQTKAFYDSVAEDIAAISKNPDAAAVEAEYIANGGNLSAALSTVWNRKQAEEAARKRHEEEQKAREAREAAIATLRAAMQGNAPAVPAPAQKAPTPAPAPAEHATAPEYDPIKTMRFTVTAPLSRLRALKKYLIQEGYING